MIAGRKSFMSKADIRERKSNQNFNFLAHSTGCPLYRRERTFAAPIGMSASGQKRASRRSDLMSALLAEPDIRSATSLRCAFRSARVSQRHGLGVLQFDGRCPMESVDLSEQWRSMQRMFFPT